MITIKEIAQRAGVSKATVSRVINGNGYVSSDTREKIEKIIREEHYTPSAAAQNLSKSRTSLIGVVIPELENFFFSEVLSGVSEILDQSGYTMLVCSTNDSKEKEIRAMNLMEKQRVDGIILTPASGYTQPESARAIRMNLRQCRMPVILVDREIDNVTLDGVFYENFQSGYLATERLIKLGRRKIGIITGDMEFRHSRDRYGGFCQAMEDYNREINRKYIYNGRHSQKVTYELTRKILASGDYPDGIVLSNNETALGFVHGLYDFHMRPGREIWIVGIDHIPVLDMVGYKYDCVTRDMKEMGRTAARMLLRRIENPGRKQEIQIIPCIPKFNMKQEW